MNLRISDFTDALIGTPFAGCSDSLPWALTQSIEARLRDVLAGLDLHEWQVQGDVAIHRSGRDGCADQGPSRDRAARLSLVDQELAASS